MGLDGAIIGQYHIIEQIGKGGMATVYKAYQPNLDRYVAVKVLVPNSAEAPSSGRALAGGAARSRSGRVKNEKWARFEREARAVARLRHRNILTVFDYGRQGDMLYLVMEYVGGGTLVERLGWPQELAYAVNIISQVGDALAHAHRQGMIHRDVKPGNILMAEEDWPLLSDFGLAKMIEDSLQLTASGASVGTPQYMSPEQAQSLAVDQRSDIYSLGAVLYEAVTGRPPFGTDSPMAVMLRHIKGSITPPNTLRSDLPKEVEHVILKALAKSPADRYQRMEEFLADLREAYPHPVNRFMVQPGNRHVEYNGPSAAPKAISTPLIRNKPRSEYSQRARYPIIKFLWTGVATGTVLLLALALILLLWPVSGRPSLSWLISSRRGLLTPTSLPTPTGLPTPTLRTGPSTATPSIQIRVWEADGAEMVFVPAGEFVMGSEDLGDDEQPSHRVYLDDFWIDRYEVTNECFARFVAATGYQTEAEIRGWGWVWMDSDGSTRLTTGWEKVEGANWKHDNGQGELSGPSIEDKADHPVVLVSWDDADAYCRWAGKQLPSEAQWEKAARGSLLWPVLDKKGLPTPTGRRYAWGDEFDSAKANTRESGRGGTTPVGSFSPQGDSPYGASDMTGNVWEWVADWYGSDYYSQAPPINPPGPTTGTYKVLRGGSWPFDEVYARTSFRYKVKPDYTYDFAGFRCSSQEK